MVLEATRTAKTTHKNPHHGKVLLSDVANGQQKEEGEWVRQGQKGSAAGCTYGTALSACSLLWRLAKEGDVLQETQVFGRNMKRPQGEDFKPQGAVQGSTEMATGQGHPVKQQKNWVFTGFWVKIGGLFSIWWKRRGLTLSACPPTSCLLLFSFILTGLKKTGGSS